MARSKKIVGKTPPKPSVWQKLGRGPWPLLALTLIALLHRLFFLNANRDRAWPFTIFYEGDTRVFYEYALALLRGDLFDNGIPFHPPGFPYLLSAVYTILDADVTKGIVPHYSVKVAMALMGSASVGLLYSLVHPYLGRATATLCSLLCASHFGLMVISIAPLSETPYLLMLIGALLLWSRRLPHPFSVGEPGTGKGLYLSAAGLGVILGLMALTRAESALMAVLLVGAGLVGVAARFREAGWLKPLLPWLLVCLAWVLTVAPWTLRNQRTLTEVNQNLGPQLAEPLPTFVPITIYGPINLAMANHGESDGTFSRAVISSGTNKAHLDITNPQHLAFLLHGRENAFAYIGENPSDFAGLVLKKWALFFDVGRLGWTQWDLPGGLDGVRRPIDVFVPHSQWAKLQYLPILAGLLLAWRAGGRQRRFALLVTLLTLMSMLVVAFFFGYVRQGLLLLPFWLALAALALTRTYTALAHRLPILLTPRAGYLALAVLLLLLLAEGLGARADRNYIATGSSFTPNGKLNSQELVTLEVERKNKAGKNR